MDPHGSDDHPKADGGERRRDRSFTAFGARVPAAASAPGLHVVATPIGNLGDITLRALHTLAGADAVLAEDTRVSRVLLNHYAIDAPLIPYHEHNAAAMRPQVLARLAAGQALALISEDLVRTLTVFYALLGVSLFVPIVAGLYVPRTSNAAALASIAAGVVAMTTVHLATGGGKTLTATVRDGTTKYVLNAGTTLLPGGQVIVSGTTYSLASGETAVVVDGKTSLLSSEPASNSAGATTSTTSERGAGDFIASGIGETSKSRGGASWAHGGVDKWVESLVMGLAGWLLWLL